MADLVQDGVRLDEVEDRAEVAPQPHGYGRDELGEGRGVRDGHSTFGGGAREPLLEGVPRREIRPFRLTPGEGGEDVAGLLPRVGDDEAE